MMIRPTAERNAVGFVGRSVKNSGEFDGSARYAARPADTVTLGGATYNFAKLYQPTPLYKMMGSVELVCAPE